MSVSKEFNRTKDLVESVLANHPETRGSDTKLYIQCCKELGARTLDDLNNVGLNIITIHKTRQVIQNKEGKYKAGESIQQARQQRSIDVREYMRNN